MKRSIRGEQTLDMNFTDFEKATGGKKVKLGFSTITLDHGRIDRDAKHPALVSDLVLVLQQSQPAETLMQHQKFSFSMNTNCQLMIRNSTELIGI